MGGVCLCVLGSGKYTRQDLLCLCVLGSDAQGRTGKIGFVCLICEFLKGAARTEAGSESLRPSEVLVKFLPSL